MHLLFCFLVLFASWTYAQSQLPFNLTDFVEGGEVYVSPCGIAVVKFKAQTALTNFFFDLSFRAVTNTPFSVWLSLKAPGAILDYKSCQPSQTCTTSTTCVLTDGCGNQAQTWYAYVETTGSVEGRFSLSLSVTGYPNHIPVPIDADNNVNGLQRFGGGPVVGTPVVQFDWYSFNIGTKPPGTLVKYEVLAETAFVNSYLFRGAQNAYPNAGCITGTPVVNRTALSSCEVSQGGVWSLAIQRTVNDQFYKLRVWYEDPIAVVLVENRAAPAQLRAVDDLAYFRYNVPAGASSTNPMVSNQIYFVLDNVVGGSVEIGLYYNTINGRQCAALKTCSSLEGCHLKLENCEIQAGFYTVIARATDVHRAYIPVSFAVTGFLRPHDITPNTYQSPKNVRGSVFLSDYQGFKFIPLHTEMIGDWMDIEVYIDRDEQDDVPASVFIGSSPFPANSSYLCGSAVYKQCETTIAMGNQRYCFIQLDPCDLEKFQAGVYVTVYSNNQINGVTKFQEHTHKQNPMDFTIYTTIRNPNSNLINHGTVLTDEVTEGWKKAYRVDDSVRSGSLEVAISANYHFNFPLGNALVTNNDTARTEIDVQVIYSQTPYIGPSCLTCYRVQDSFSVSLRALETFTFTIRKCVQGTEHVYIVISGNNTRSRVNATSTLFNFTDNRFVLTAKNFPVSKVETIKPTEFSNIISGDSSFGGLQFWLLDFDQELLRTSTLSLKLRAHPRSGRNMVLTIDNDFDPQCAAANRPDRCGGFEPPVTFSCAVNETNKGYCYINIQTCVLIPYINRTFYVRIASFPRANLTVPDVPVEFAYSFTYDLTPQVATPVALGKETQIIVDLEAEQYQHFSVDLPAGSVGRDTLIFEAYFDSNNLYSTKKSIFLFVNEPYTNGLQQVLAGNPQHSAKCLCFDRFESDDEKVVMVIDRCALIAGTYYFSVYTDSFGFKEGQSHVTIKVYTVPYVTQIAYELPYDFSLYPKQSAAYQIAVDAQMLTSVTRTDKELQIWAFSNIAQYNGSIVTRLTNSIGDCGCGQTLNDVNYPCGALEDTRATQVGGGRCDIIVGMCDLTAGPWYIITNLVDASGSRKLDRHQVTPFTLTATKANTITTVRPLALTRSDTCSPSDRVAQSITQNVRTEEWQYWNVQGNNPSGFSIYVDNVTFGSLTIYAGTTTLPSGRCNASSVACAETPAAGGPSCVFSFGGCGNINYIGIKVVSNKKNTDVRYTISSCIRNDVAVAETLTFNDMNGKTVVVANNGAQPITFTMPMQAAADSPYVIVSVVRLAGAGSFSVSLGRGSCGACAPSLAVSCNNTGSNCTIFVPYCDIPNDHATGNWQIIISNTGAGSSFTAVVFAVKNNIGVIPLITGTASNFNIAPLSWTNIQWTLGVNDLVPFGTGTETSTLAFTFSSAALARFQNRNDGSCLAPFTETAFTFSSCCTLPGVYTYSFFNRDTVNSQSVSATPDLITRSQNHTRVAWPTGAPQISVPFTVPSIFTGGLTRLREYYTIFPGVAQFGTLLFSFSGPSTTTAFIQRTALAGPSGQGGCFASQFAVPLTNFVTQPIFACSGSTNPLTPVSIDSYFPQGIWVGLENRGNNPEIGVFNVTAIPPIGLTRGVAQQAFSVIQVNQQFFYKPSINNAYINRIFRIRVQVLDGTVTPFVNVRTAAGPTGSCLGNIRAGTATNAGATATLEVPTCPPITETMWIGVVTSSLTSAYTVTVEEINTLEDASTPATIIQPNIPSFITSPSASTNFDFTYPNTLGAMTWLRITVDNITMGSTYTITHYRDGICDGRSNTLCQETSNFGYKCTTIISGCRLQPSVLNHIVVAGPGGASYTIIAEILNFAAGAGNIPIVDMPPPKGNPGEELRTTFTASVLPHDIALYRVPLRPSDILPGEDFQLFLDSTSCGSIEVYGFVGGQPGPFCTNENKICSAPGCLIASGDQCDTFHASTATSTHNFAQDIYALVRGRAHSEGNVAIRFSFRIHRLNSYVVRHMYYLEKHNLLPVPPTPVAGTAAQCPASNVPTIQSCCSAVAATSGSWIWQPTVFHFPVEGAHFLNDLQWQRVKLSIANSNFIDGASISVWNQQPSFCASQEFPNRANNIGRFTSCTVTRASPECTVNLYIPVCGLVNSHLLFLTVENMTFSAGALPAAVAAFGDGVTVSHTRIPNNIIGINIANGARQYFEGDLIRDQIQYFKVFHDQASTPNYHFNVQMLRVDGGSVALHHLWNACPNTRVCESTQCEDLDPRNETLADCKVDPDCDCNYEHIMCRDGDMNAAPVREGFFHIRGSSLAAGRDIVHFVILVEFIEPLETLTNVICGNETCEQERYYNNVPRAGPEELYRFRLTSVNGEKNILIAHDNFIGLDGYDNSVQANSCQATRKCDSLKNGQLDQCVTFYRTVADGLPYVSVHTSAKCDNRQVTRYNLNFDKLTPPIVTLTDGVTRDSQVFTADPLAPGCTFTNQSYWYKVSTRANFQYMVVELWGEQASEQMQFWVTKNHVSYHAFGENLAIGCQTSNTAANGQYCRYVVACSYVPGGLYYIQVSDSSPKPKMHPYFRHRIRVTSMNAIDNTIAFGQDFSFDISADLRQIQTVTITGVSGNQEQAWKDFVAYTFSQTPIDSWMTRNKLGDATCSVSSFVGRTNARTHVVPECQVDAAGGIFKVHFMMNPSNLCTPSRVVSVTSRFNTPGALIYRQLTGTANAAGTFTINSRFGESVVIKYAVPPLGANDIVYSRLSNFDTTTRLTTTIYKGNHLNVDRNTYALPCGPGCSESNKEESSFMAWGDVCYHCGQREYNTIFVKVDALATNGNTSFSQAATFTSTLRVTQPTPLTGTPQTGTHAREEPSLNFYSADYTRDKGSRIELTIAKSAAIGVEINVYASDCGLRTNPSQYWCFPGHTCSIPTPERHNFGSTYVQGLKTSPYIAPKFLLVVRAVDASYTILQTQGSASCSLITAQNGPFCSSFGNIITGRTYWGNANTFLEKDNNAREFYANLTQRFSCPEGSDHCDCSPLSQPCRDALAVYACLAMYNPCDADGLELLPSKVDCDNVESVCPKTFRCAGYPERACGSSIYYLPPIPAGTPTFSPPPTIPNTTVPTVMPSKAPTPAPTRVPTAPTDAPTIVPDASAASNFPQWVPGVVIFLIVLVTLLLIAVIIGAVLLFSAGAPRVAEVDAYQAL